MSNLRSSANYVWNVSEASTLGSGATANVYQGVNKQSGKEVAVKSFIQRSAHLQMREFEVMKVCTHENLVKMISIEKEVFTGKDVIIMELCNGGNLFSILNHPENSFGLLEEEFLCVLRDITLGMKFLRDNNITHRDLKPGNIMKCITEDGCSVYKLTDFGAAKILKDQNEEFQSLHGTEEYLHPDMYKRCIFGKSASECGFNATVDLWSIGATLYHVATGSVPFQPFGGRKNRETMYRITTKKESGVISGVQSCLNGEIKWSKELPKTCLLSRQLKNLVTELIAGLLESDDKKNWGFEKYFQYANDVTSRKVFHIFHVNTGQEITFYLPTNKKLQDLQDLICAETKVPNSAQLLFFDNYPFMPQINESLDASSFPTTSVDKPLILIQLTDINMKDYIRYITDHVSSRMLQQSAEISECDKVKLICSVAHTVKYFVGKLVRCQELLLSVPKIVMILLKEKVAKICSNFDLLKVKTERAIHSIEMLEKSHSLVSKFVSIVSNGHDIKKDTQKMRAIISEQKRSKEQIEENVRKLLNSVDFLKQRILISNSLLTEWNEVLPEVLSLTGCCEKANTYIKNLHESWQVFLKFHALSSFRTLSANDQQFHRLEWIKVNTNATNLEDLVKQCLQSCLSLTEMLNKWYNKVQHILAQCDSVENDILCANKDLDTNSCLFFKAESETYEISERLVSLFEIAPSSSNGTRSKRVVENGKTQASSGSRKKISSLMHSFKQSQGSLQETVEENAHIFEKMRALFSLTPQED